MEKYIYYNIKIGGTEEDRRKKTRKKIQIYAEKEAGPGKEKRKKTRK